MAHTCSGCCGIRPVVAPATDGEDVVILVQDRPAREDRPSRELRHDRRSWKSATKARRQHAKHD